jgi:hypothetical protein
MMATSTRLRKGLLEASTLRRSLLDSRKLAKVSNKLLQSWHEDINAFLLLLGFALSLADPNFYICGIFYMWVSTIPYATVLSHLWNRPIHGWGASMNGTSEKSYAN